MKATFWILRFSPYRGWCKSWRCASLEDTLDVVKELKLRSDQYLLTFDR